MPSPTCEISEDGDPYVATTNGVDVTAATEIIIRLTSGSGVTSWGISCIGTDETQVAATVTSGLDIDTTLKTATFTSPAAGTCLIFQSVVNGGVDNNGITQASYTTTFAIHTLTAGGDRVAAFNETTESNSSVGWTEKVNAAIRGIGSGGVPELPIASAVGQTLVCTVTGDPSTYVAGALNLADTDAVTGTLPVGNGGTGITALGSGVATFLGTPSSANLAAAVTGETGSGALVFGTGPTISTALLTSSPVLTTPWLPDSNASHHYKTVVSDLAADRNVTWPLLTTDDTLVFLAHAGVLTNKTINGALINNPNVTDLWLIDSAVNSYYKFVVSDLAADRNITLPVLLSDDTFVFQDHIQTLVGKTLTSPTLGGTPVISATAITATGNARGRVYSNIANVQTTDATVTSLFTWTILDEAVTLVTYEGGACLSTAADTAAYVRRIKFKCDGGSVTAGTVEATFTDESSSTWDCTIDNSTTTGRVRVTGAAVTIDHAGVISRLEVSHA